MNKKKQRRYSVARNTTIFLLICSLVLLLVGVTYALYFKFLKGTTSNFIQAGSISFSYNEDQTRGNGVRIENAYQTPDSFGKVMSGTNQYFDFSVNANSTLADVSYQVIVLKQPNSTLNEDYAKIYLTTKNGSVETASPLVEKNQKVLTYGELNFSHDKTGKVVYTGVVPKNEKNYHQEFRLRMWLADDRQILGSLDQKIFSVKVKVVANEVH